MDLHDFLTPVAMAGVSDDEIYTEGQMGRHIQMLHENDFDIEAVDIVIVGIRETRGSGRGEKENEAANIIRKHLYRLHCWHPDIQIADAGNVVTGAALSDSYAALRTVLEEFYERKKTVILLGGSHDNTLAQYHAYRKSGRLIEATCIDAEINLQSESRVPAENFLMEIFTGDFNILKHYNHIAFQSYFVHPRMLETIDKLRFDCYRLGMVKESIEETEPVLRNSDMLSFDISAVKHSDAPANKNCPNGLTGIEACTLTRFAGMSETLSSAGFYGYRPADDADEITARQVSQMIWYFIDGRHRLREESALEERHLFNEFHTAFGEVDTVFLQSKRTNRWWMQMPDGKFIACTQNDYITAGQNDFPERWLRVQERN